MEDVKAAPRILTVELKIKAMKQEKISSVNRVR
jgi:hypothetical protein